MYYMWIIRGPAKPYIFYLSSTDKTRQDHLFPADQPGHWFWLIKRIAKKINGEYAVLNFVLLSLGSQCQSIWNAAEGPDIMCNMHAHKALQITFSIFLIKPIFELWWFLQFMALAIFQMCNITAQGYRNSLPQKTPTWQNNDFTSKFSIQGTDISKEDISVTLVILKYKNIKIHLTWTSILFLACEIKT